MSRIAVDTTVPSCVTSWPLADLHGEFRAIFSQATKFPVCRRFLRKRIRTSCEYRRPFGILASESLGEEHFSGMPEELFALVAKQSLRLCIDKDDFAMIINNH